ncbi:MAG: CHRD domain-containing protein [Verrucomicrobiota bacterium]|nr:CHRD domain-containing protein [Verrucomicrobiota bacterium]
MRIMHVITLGVFTACCAGVLQGANVLFDLQGQAGFGLLPGNETGVVAGNPGAGGEVGAGIVFDDVTRELTVNVAWGTANGFTNLSGNASAGHIHGPTASAAPTSFTQSVGVLIGLDGLAGWNNNASAGGITGVVTIPSNNVADLLAGKLYINVHTATNGGGEIRGNLIAVPEPSSIAAIAGILVFGLALVRHRRR